MIYVIFFLLFRFCDIDACKSKDTSLQISLQKNDGVFSKLLDVIGLAKKTNDAENSYSSIINAAPVEYSAPYSYSYPFYYSYKNFGSDSDSYYAPYSPSKYYIPPYVEPAETAALVPPSPKQLSATYQRPISPSNQNYYPKHRITDFTRNTFESSAPPPTPPQYPKRQYGNKFESSGVAPQYPPPRQTNDLNTNVFEAPSPPAKPPQNPPRYHTDGFIGNTLDSSSAPRTGSLLHRAQYQQDELSGSAFDSPPTSRTWPLTRYHPGDVTGSPFVSPAPMEKPPPYQAHSRDDFSGNAFEPPTAPARPSEHWQQPHSFSSHTSSNTHEETSHQTGVVVESRVSVSSNDAVSSSSASTTNTRSHLQPTVPIYESTNTCQGTNCQTGSKGVLRRNENCQGAHCLREPVYVDPCADVQCAEDQICRTEEGQCHSSHCESTANCVNPCDEVACPQNLTCSLVSLWCNKPRCPSVPVCGGDPCRHHVCPRGQRCYPKSLCHNSVCRIEPVCQDPCQYTKCPDGEYCYTEDVACEKAPCNPVPVCRNPCSTVQCAVNQKCVVREIDCTRIPCSPAAFCEPF